MSNYDQEEATAIAELPGQSEGTPQAPAEGTQDTQPAAENTGAPQTQTVGGDPNWKANDWQLKYRDQTIVPKDKNHLISLAQQGYSYSQRMHELGEREKQLNSQSEQYKQYQALEEAFQKNPAFREQIMNWYQNSLTPGIKPPEKQQGENQPQLPPELLKEIQELKGWKQEFQTYQQQQLQQQAESEVASEIDKLKEKYSRQDWDQMGSNGLTLTQEVVKHALDNNGIKLESAFRDMMYDQQSKNSEAEGLKKAAELQAANKKAGVVSGGKGRNGGGHKADEPTSAMDYNQIEKMIKSDYGINS